MSYMPEMMLTNYMCQEKKEEEDLPALKTALTHRYNDSKAMNVQKGGERLITGIRNNTDDTWINRTETSRKQKWEEKKNSMDVLSGISFEETWSGPRKGNLKRETESLLIAAQNYAIRTHHIKARIDKTQENSRCRLCADRDETINNIISECTKFAQKIKRLGTTGWARWSIHRGLCKKLKFNNANKWYKHNTESVLENETHKLLWDFTNRSPNLGQTTRPCNNQPQQHK